MTRLGVTRAVFEAGKLRADPLYTRVWRLLRIRRRLTTAEAVALLCDGDDSAQALRRATGVVGRYLRHLALAGYLELMPQSDVRRGKRYVLVRDTGSRPPVHTRMNTMFDPNEGIHHAFVA